MLLTGLAMPYHVEILEDAGIESTKEGEQWQPARRVMFYNGAYTAAIRDNDIDVTLNHCRGQDLGSSKYGLRLFETRAGLYFDLRLPSTPFAQSVYQAVVVGKVRHICAVSNWTHGNEENGVYVVRTADLRSLSLLLTADAHAPRTWIMPAGPEAEQRIDSETAAASNRHLWALRPDVPAVLTLNEATSRRIAELEQQVKALRAQAPH